jgi:hypothetical protein
MIQAFKHHAAFTLFFFIYALLGCINLDRLPVAWTDEVLNLDPAVQYLQHGYYFSKLWPNPGSHLIFASYLPGIQWFQTLYLGIVPFDIFWIRWPFLCLMLVSIILVYKTLLRNKNLKPEYATLLLALIFLDKASFELARSMRVEVLIIFGTSCLFYLSQYKKTILLQSFIFGYLFMCHAYLWPFIGVWFGMKWIHTNTSTKIFSLLFFLLPLFFFTASLGFNFNPLLEQMGFHMSQHTLVKTDLPHHPILNSLWYRFFPFYLEQPMIPVLFYGIIFCLVYLILKKPIWKSPLNYPQLGWLLSIFLLFTVLTPQYRYLPFFWLTGIILIALNKQTQLTVPWLKVLMGLAVMNAAISFMGRHSAALLQKNARDPISVQKFLQKKLDHRELTSMKKSLILGESIGFYFAHQEKNRTHFDYGVDFYPQHFDWNQYDNIYLLTHKVRIQDTLIGVYRSKQELFTTPNFMLKFAKGGTYNGMRIYQLKP